MVAEMDTTETWLLIVSACATLLTVVLFGVHLLALSLSPARTRTVTRTSYLLAIMPITAIASLLGVTMPRAEPMITILINTCFARVLFGFVEYIAVDVYGDRTRMKHELRDVKTRMNFVPLTCFCPCLPQPKATP